jgi:hypothetical protein
MPIITAVAHVMLPQSADSLRTSQTENVARDRALKSKVRSREREIPVGPRSAVDVVEANGTRGE